MLGPGFFFLFSQSVLWWTPEFCWQGHNKDQQQVTFVQWRLFLYCSRGHKEKKNPKKLKTINLNKTVIEDAAGFSPCDCRQVESGLWPDDDNQQSMEDVCAQSGRLSRWWSSFGWTLSSVLFQNRPSNLFTPKFLPLIQPAHRDVQGSS